MEIEQSIEDTLKSRRVNECKQIFGKIIQSEQCVGDIYSINYETAKVIINDFFKHEVGGIPSLSFLIATRVNPDSEINFADEEASFILLRVMDSAQLPQDKEAERIRVEAAQRVSGEAQH